jgi:hypothetical protein
MKYSRSAQFSTLALIVMLFGGTFGLYYFNTSAILGSQEQSISSLQSKVNFLQHTSPSSTTITITTSSLITSTTTESSILYQTKTTTQFAGPPSIYNIESTNVSLSFQPGNMVVNPKTHAVYVAGLFSNDFMEINGTNGSVVWKIALPSTEQGRMAVDSAANIVFVPVIGCTNLAGTSNACGTVSRPVPSIIEIDGATGSRIKMLNFSTRQDVAQVATGEGTGVLLAATRVTAPPAFTSGNFLMIDFKTGMVMRNISLNASPLDGSIDGLALNPRTGIAYLSVCSLMGTHCLGSIIAVNTTSFRTTSITVPGGGEFLSVGVNPSTNTVYAACYQYYLNSTHAVLVAIDGTTNQIIRNTRLGAFFSHADIVQVNPEQNEIYVLSQDANGILWIVDGTNGSILGSYIVPGTPEQLEFDPNLQSIYVAVTSSGAKPLGSVHILMVKVTFVR